MPYDAPAPWYNPIKKVPIIGKAYGRIGQVYQIWSQPCDPSPYIMVYAAWVGTPRLLWSLFQPDFIDYKYDSITKRFKTHGRRAKFKIFESAGPSYPIPRGLGWAIFRGAEFAQRVGWYFCVIDAVGEFIVNWSTMVYQYSGCEAPGISYANLVMDQTGVILGPEPSEGFSQNFKTAYATGFGTGPTGVFFSGMRNVTCAWSYTAAPKSINGFPPGSFSVTLDQAGDFATEYPVSRSNNPDGTITYSGATEINSPNSISGAFRLWVTVGPGTCEITDQSMSCSGSNVKLSLDPLPGLKPVTWPTSGKK